MSATIESSPAVAADFVLRGAGELVTMSAPPAEGLGVITGGALAAKDGVIVWVGREADLPQAVDLAPDGLDIDAEGRCVLPGFVDAHTHVPFAGSRAAEYGERLAGVSYGEILARGGGINVTVEATRQASEEELARLSRLRYDSMLRHGTTTAEVKSGYGLTVADEAKQLRAAATAHPLLRELTFLGAHFVPPEYAGRTEDFIRLVCEEMIPACAPLAHWCDVFCDEGAFTVEQARRVLIAAAAAGLGLRIHADELARSGGSMLAAELGCASADHVIHATGEEIAAMKAAGVVAVMLPGTSYTLGVSFAPARAFLEAGVTIALASDFNPGTCDCENLQMMISLACQGMKLTPDEALYAATIGGAAALRRADVGSLATGKRCDFSVLVAESRTELPYHFGVNLVGDVVVGGRVVVHDGAVAHDEPALEPVPRFARDAFPSAGGPR
ncbi:MAG: imidazolonepropionase [Actinobacteria bacterium]|nr:imidazolonepropionase [Actinomycetota bacterium]